MWCLRSLALILLLALPAQAEEVIYRMSRETHDRWLKEGLAWHHFIGAKPPEGTDPEDWLMERISWGRIKSLKEAGITKELHP